MIWTEAPEAQTYQGRHHDPLFAAAEELGMPISLHIGTGYDSRHLAPGNPYYFRGAFSRFELQRGLAQIIYTGTFDRFPNLQIVLCEYGVAWVPAFTQQADRAFDQYAHIDTVRPKRKPSEYFQTNLWLTYVKDANLVANLKALGSTDRVMWSSDYPHQQSTWPKSREYIEREAGQLSDREIEALTRTNCAGLYGLDLAYLGSTPPAMVAA
jgi:predicted TIM-barrel fold metal-dependent hydrolase